MRAWQRCQEHRLQSLCAAQVSRPVFLGACIEADTAATTEPTEGLRPRHKITKKVLAFCRPPVKTDFNCYLPLGCARMRKAERQRTQPWITCGNRAPPWRIRYGSFSLPCSSACSRRCL